MISFYFNNTVKNPCFIYWKKHCLFIHFPCDTLDYDENK